MAIRKPTKSSHLGQRGNRTAFPTEPINSAPSTQPSIAGASERESSMGSMACDGVIESNETKMPMGGARWATLNPMLI